MCVNKFCGESSLLLHYIYIEVLAADTQRCVCHGCWSTM